MSRLEGLAGFICGVMGIGPGWDCRRCRLDGPNNLLQLCRDSMEYIGRIAISMGIFTNAIKWFFKTNSYFHQQMINKYKIFNKTITQCGVQDSNSGFLSSRNHELNQPGELSPRNFPNSLPGKSCKLGSCRFLTGGVGASSRCLWIFPVHLPGFPSFPEIRVLIDLRPKCNLLFIVPLPILWCEPSSSGWARMGPLTWACSWEGGRSPAAANQGADNDSGGFADPQSVSKSSAMSSRRLQRSPRACPRGKAGACGLGQKLVPQFPFLPCAHCLLPNPPRDHDWHWACSECTLRLRTRSHWSGTFYSAGDAG